MKKSYKKYLGVLLSVLMVLSLCACGAGNKELSDEITIGTLNGPTGMGLIGLEENENIDLEQYQAPDEVVQKFISGDLDIACLPSNMGAILNSKTDGNVVVLTTIVNGVLFLVENPGDEGSGISDIKDLAGKTILASGKGGTPEYVLQALLENAGLTVGEDVQIQWLDAHADVAQKLLASENTVALLPEPFVSTVLNKSENAKVAVDLNEAWEEMTGNELPMGILLAKKDFVENNAEDIETLLALVSDSIDNVNTASDEVAASLVEEGFIGDETLCKSVIPRLSLVCMSSADSKATLTSFYEKLYAVNPASVGGKLPGEDLFY